MSKDLLKFLFAESFKPEVDEVIANVFEQMGLIEDLEIKKKPLEKALKDLGFDVKVEVDENGAFARLEDGCKYGELVSKLKQAEAIVTLAELGWVPAFANDVNSNADPACFVITFIDISEVEPSDSDTVPDLEKLVKGMADDSDEDHPEGMGADLKAPKTDDKGVKVPAAPKVKSAIKDSLEEGATLYEQSFENVMAEFQALNPEVQQLVRQAAVDTLKESGFEEIGSSDVNHSVVRLFREYGNWDEIAKSVSPDA
jgi:hypothetical protein